VLAAGGDSPARAVALEQLCRTYWYPLYAFVRRSGRSPHDAQDLTQAFFAEVFQKDYFRAADRERGKFRSFLLTALRHFLIDEWEKGNAVKRGGGVAPVSWDEEAAEDWYQHEPATLATTPERLYDRSWALRVFVQGLERLRQEANEQGKSTQFDRLKNYLTQEPGQGAYTAMAASLGLSPNAVAVAVHRLRQRYAALVRQCVAETVAQPNQVEEELTYLISLICD
jgi:RNA polymerase sigma-70 factor (ECF subfamily)